MNMQETLYNNEERIERYLHGEMTPEEESIFEEDLANDDTLRRQAEAMARAVKGMETVGGEQDRLMIEKMKTANGTFRTIDSSIFVSFPHFRIASACSSVNRLPKSSFSPFSMLMIFVCDNSINDATERIMRV
jgi:hypothetical protein